MKEPVMRSLSEIKDRSVVSTMVVLFQYVIDLAFFLLIVFLSSIVVFSVAIAAPLAVGISALVGRKNKLARPHWTAAKA